VGRRTPGAGAASTTAFSQAPCGRFFARQRNAAEIVTLLEQFGVRDHVGCWFVCRLSRAA
jgi:hypothetical protein